MRCTYVRHSCTYYMTYMCAHVHVYFKVTVLIWRLYRLVAPSALLDKQGSRGVYDKFPRNANGVPNNEFKLRLLKKMNVRLHYAVVFTFAWFGGAELRSQPQGRVNSPKCFKNNGLSFVRRRTNMNHVVSSACCLRMAAQQL